MKRFQLSIRRLFLLHMMRKEAHRLSMFSILSEKTVHTIRFWETFPKGTEIPHFVFFIQMLHLMFINLLKNLLFSIIFMPMPKSALTDITGQLLLMLLIILKKPGQLIMAEGEEPMIMKEGRLLLLLPPGIYGIRLSIKD